MDRHSREILARSHARRMSGDPSETIQQREATEKALQALLELPLELREALALVSIEGHSPKEAAYILGVNDGTLRTRLFQGRKRLKNMLGIRDEV